MSFVMRPQSAEIFQLESATVCTFDLAGFSSSIRYAKLPSASRRHATERPKSAPLPAHVNQLSRWKSKSVRQLSSSPLPSLPRPISASPTRPDPVWPSPARDGPGRGIWLRFRIIDANAKVSMAQ